MNRPPDRDKLVMELCDRLVALGPQEREAFLNLTCVDKPELRREVEELLESIENSGKFLCLDDRETKF